MKDYYYILGVKPDATATEIKAAYRKLSKKFHPDMNDGDSFFEERFKEIQEAHETLIDPITRQRYDNSRNPNAYQKPKEPPKSEKPIPPVILAFSINKTALSNAEEFTVSWQTLNAETVTIQPFNIQVDANGNKNFRIPKLDSKLETIKIELIAQNRLGNVLRTVVLKNLEYGLLPEILSFSTNKSEYFNEEDVNVSWETKHAEKITLKPFEMELSHNGFRTIPFRVTNSQKIRMVLFAENQFGKVSLVIDVINLDYIQPKSDKESWLAAFMKIGIIGLFIWGLVSGVFFIWDKFTRSDVKEVYEAAVDSVAVEIETPFNNETVTDIDGNTYKITTIGIQTWMAENLKTTKYKDGSSINLASSDAKMCYFDNNIDNKAIYGALYNWHAVNTDKLCPSGWHVPTDKEWITLTDYLGGDTIAGMRLKASSGWNPDENGTNEVGFTALPSGYRDDNGTFFELGNDGYWWTVSSFGVSGAGSRFIYGSDRVVHRSPFSQGYGFSVRCIKD